MLKQAIICAFCLLIFTSCEHMQRQPRFKMALHQVVTDTEFTNAESSLMVKVRKVDGSEEHKVRGFPLIDSRHILKMDVIRQPDGRKAALKIYFDNFAPGIWTEVHAYHHQAKIAIIIDGFLAGFMQLPEELGKDNTMVTDPMWSLTEARLIAENAPRNYEVINER